mgnify:CR=1 FL=1
MTHDPRWQIKYQFTQPYHTIDFVYDTQNPSMNPLYQDQIILNELQRLDDIDRAVQNMLTYPDAERIINKLRQKRG